MGWQDDARRTVVSEKKYLTSLVGYWVKVRKWSISGKDEIDEAERELQKHIDRKALFEVSKRIKGIDPEQLKTMTMSELMPMLTSDEFFALTESQNTHSARVIEAKLKHGIESHNFCEGDFETRSTSKDIKGFAVQILEYPEIALEILGFVEEFNRPLPSATSPMSEMSPSGSTEEQSLNGETPYPTDGNRQP